MVTQSHTILCNYTLTTDTHKHFSLKLEGLTKDFFIKIDYLLGAILGRY